MPRTARRISESGIYHVVLRGINKQTVFYDDEDKKVFLNRLKLAKQELPHEMFAFCVMSNHVHLLLKETQASVGKVIQKILCSYVHWYNRKYERIGNLFQDRYKSEPIENDAHLLCCLRYIHQNPLKAGVVGSIEEYAWSSHSLYANQTSSFVSTDLLLDMLGGTKEYLKFVSKDEMGEYVDFDDKAMLSDEKLLARIKEIYVEYGVKDLTQLDVKKRDEILKRITQIPGSTARRISRLTGMSIMIVRRAK